MDYEQRTARYLELAERMLDEAFGDERRLWIQRVEAELPPIREVLAWLREQGDVGRGLQLAYLLQELWFEEQHTEEGLELIQAFLAMDGADQDPARQAMALDLAGALALNLNRFELAGALKREAIALLRTLGNQRQLAYTLLHQGHLLGYAQGDYREAAKVYEEALTLFTELNDEEGIAHAMYNVASARLELGALDTAPDLVYGSLRRYSELGSQWDLAVALANVAVLAAAERQYQRALILATASATHRERIGVSLPQPFAERLARIERAAASRLDEEEEQTARATGRALTLAEAVDYALRNASSAGLRR